MNQLPTPSTAASSAPSPHGLAATIGASCKSSPVGKHDETRTGLAVAPNQPTYSHCPDCGSLFSYRITDEDTGCRYPVDDGEHYCRQCDSIWTDEYLAEASFEPLVYVERIAPGRVAL